MAKNQTKYDAYASCLGKALCYINTPATVGLYAPWGSQINLLLHKVEGKMVEESLAIERKEIKRTSERPRLSTGFGFLILLWRLVFYKPQLTELHRRRRNVRFIFIQFSAWEFAGSDKLWAGLITTLCENIRNKFGNLPTGIVRAVSRETAIPSSPLSEEWVSKRILKIHLWLLSFLLMALGVALIAVVFTFGFPVGDHGDKKVVAAETLGVGLVGFSALFAFKNSFMVAKNVVVSQKDTVNSLMNQTNYSAQLGFMSEVKTEVKILTNFIHYMEIFERRKIRVILKIVSLDRCTPDKVVGVLDAMNILLSDPEAPFISVLAVDPSIIASCVENSSLLKGVADNGYEYLGRTVTLPFSVPEMDIETKLVTLQQLIDGKGELLGCSQPHQQEPPSGKPGAGGKATTEESAPLVTITTTSTTPAEEGGGGGGGGTSGDRNKPSNLTKSAFDYIIQNKCLHDLIAENYLQMKRIVNTIPIMLRLMVNMDVEVAKFPPDRVAAWVILASHWPCRLSWIWQCLEDLQQRNELNKEEEVDGEMTLFQIYEANLDEFGSLLDKMGKLLELDGDPELFQKLLQDSYRFTVWEANLFLPYTINLDHSLKRKMELMRGKQDLKSYKKPTAAPTQVSSPMLNLSVEDICQLMENIGLKPERLELYKSKIRLNDLNGKALQYCDEDEIRGALEMSLGDWASFKHFLLQVQKQPVTAPPPQKPTCQSNQRVFLQGNTPNPQGQQYSIAV